MNLNDVSNVLFLGDSHGNVAFIAKALHAAIIRQCEVIVQAGDFGIWDHTQRGKDFLVAVETHLNEIDVILIFVDGNHENFDSLYARPIDDDGFRRVTDHIWHAPRGHIWQMGEKIFLAMGGAHSIDGPGGPPWWKKQMGQGRGPLDEAIYYAGGSNRLLTPSANEVYRPKGYDLGGWWPQEMITEDEVMDAISNVIAHPKEVDVMVSHDCPLGVEIPGIGGYELGDLNRDRLEQVFNTAQPDLFVCGHYHKRFSTTYNGTKIEILAADVSNEEQALAVSLGDLTTASKG